MDQTKQEILRGVVTEILQNIPHRPMLCLPMSALLYAMLKDNFQIETKFVVGDLLFGNKYIFKQDFSLFKAKENVYQEWSGHAWVELDNLICDLSLFRTLNSDSFDRPYKADLIKIFGKGQDALIASPKDLSAMSLHYRAVEELSDEIATGIIRGLEVLLINN